MTVIAPMLEEFRSEAVITRRVLERVPTDKLSWKPHPKSMTLGQLAQHIASVPGGTRKSYGRIHSRFPLMPSLSLSLNIRGKFSKRSNRACVMPRNI